jgi:hydrogenase maturation factor HypF (carbamoyltransferase family)
MNSKGTKGITEIHPSGSVFQNKILMAETLCLLREDEFSSYYNKTAPPNDGNIALSQAYIAMHALKHQRACGRMGLEEGICDEG